jgi:hypothetical protein
MERPFPRPDTLNKLKFGADAAFAMLAGMQLDVFTPLRSGPMSADEIANAIGVGPTRLRLLLYGLVVAGLLTEQDGCFSNTPEADQFLVKGAPLYMGTLLSHRWIANLPKTAESIRRGFHRLKSISPMLHNRN